MHEGQFELDAGPVIRARREGNRLLGREVGDEKPTESLPAGADAFFVDGDPGEWTFGRGADGEVDRLISRLAGSDIQLHGLK